MLASAPGVSLMAMAGLYRFRCPVACVQYSFYFLLNVPTYVAVKRGALSKRLGASSSDEGHADAAPYTGPAAPARRGTLRQLMAENDQVEPTVSVFDRQSETTLGNGVNYRQSPGNILHMMH